MHPDGRRAPSPLGEGSRSLARLPDGSIIYGWEHLTRWWPDSDAELQHWSAPDA